MADRTPCIDRSNGPGMCPARPVLSCLAARRIRDPSSSPRGCTAPVAGAREVGRARGGVGTTQSPSLWPWQPQGDRGALGAYPFQGTVGRPRTSA